MKEGLGIFIGQTKTKLVRGRMKFKVRNNHVASHEEPEFLQWEQMGRSPELTELERLYKEFCEKAYQCIVKDPSMNGDHLPHRIIFSDFYYDVIPSKFPIE